MVQSQKEAQLQDPDVEINLPPEMVAYWDANLRPDQFSIPRAVEANASRIKSDSKIPTVRVSDTPIERIKEADVARHQAQRERRRVNLNTEDVAQALGLKRMDADGNLIVSQEIPVNELVSRAFAYMYTEQYRRMFGVGELIKMTGRTIVPASRVSRIQKDVNRRFATYFSESAQKVCCK